jgi:hypothetical protein
MKRAPSNKSLERTVNHRGRAVLAINCVLSGAEWRAHAFACVRKASRPLVDHGNFAIRRRGGRASHDGSAYRTR